MIGLLLRGLARDLELRLGDNRMAAAMGKLPPAERRAPFPAEMDDVRVCAVQAEARLFGSLNALVREIDGYFHAAAGENADLVCFPELFGVLPASVLPAVRFFLRTADMAAGSSSTGASPGGSKGAGAPAGKAALAPLGVLHARYLYLMGLFARRYGVYVSCGTSFAIEDGRIYNRHTLLSPGGAEVCRADKMHLTLEEQSLCLSAGDTLGLIDLPIGKVALAVCMDATYYETFRAAKALGADYILLPIGDMAAFDPWLARRGAQSRVSETGLIAVKAALTSAKGFPLTMTGRAGVYFPLESGCSSVETSDAHGRGMACATLSLGQIRAFTPRLFCRRNPAFDQRALEETLRRAERDGNE